MISLPLSLARRIHRTFAVRRSPFGCRSGFILFSQIFCFCFSLLFIAFWLSAFAIALVLAIRLHDHYRMSHGEALKTVRRSHFNVFAGPSSAARCVCAEKISGNINSNEMQIHSVCRCIVSISETKRETKADENGRRSVEIGIFLSRSLSLLPIHFAFSSDFRFFETFGSSSEHKIQFSCDDKHFSN